MQQKKLTFSSPILNSLSLALRKISASIDKVNFCAIFGDIADLSQKKSTTTSTNQIRIFLTQTSFLGHSMYANFHALKKNLSLPSSPLSLSIREPSQAQHQSRLLLFLSSFYLCSSRPANHSTKKHHSSKPIHSRKFSSSSSFLRTCRPNSLLHAVRHVTPRSSFSSFF